MNKKLKLSDEVREALNQAFKLLYPYLEEFPEELSRLLREFVDPQVQEDCEYARLLELLQKGELQDEEIRVLHDLYRRQRERTIDSEWASKPKKIYIK